MNICGIIAEYNPFHNGHLYHLQQAKKLTGCDGIAAVMSGNFVQRGAPALFDKFSRAEAAVLSGVDLVLELPPACAVSSAEYFAKGGVEILRATGIADALCFGSECGDLSRLETIADKQNDAGFQEALRQLMSEGIPVRQAFQRLLPDLPEAPNDILGIAYLRALQGSGIKPVLVKREGAAYHDTTLSGELVSASAIRAHYHKGGDISPYVPLMPRAVPATEEALESAILYALRSKSKEELASYADVTEGLENKLFEECRRQDSVESLIHAVKSKRYTYGRIRRILYHIFLNIPARMREQPPELIRVLAFNETGQRMLNQMKKTASLPVVTCYTAQDFRRYSTAVLDKRENDLYALARKGEKVFHGGLQARRI